MRVLIFFDLPVKTVAERKAYATFRKNLLREGFIMVQESVYSRIATTRESAGLKAVWRVLFLKKVWCSH